MFFIAIFILFQLSIQMVEMNFFLSGHNGDLTTDEILRRCPNLRPEVLSPDPENSIKVSVRFTPYRFVNISDFDEQMTINGRAEIDWYGFETCVNPNLFSNQTGTAWLFPLDSNKFWKPKIQFLRGDSTYFGQSDKRSEQMVVRSGKYIENVTSIDNPIQKFSMAVVGAFTFHCQLDLFHFPADVQTCSIQLRTEHRQEIYQFHYCSITYLIDQMNFVSENSNWRLLNLNCSINPSLDSKSQVDLSFTMVRMPTFFTLHLLLPFFYLSLLERFSFALPIGAERTTFSVTILLAFITMETILIQILPTTSQRTLLSSYLLMQGTISTITTIYSANLSCFRQQLRKRQVRFCGKLFPRRTFFDSIAFLISSILLLFQVSPLASRIIQVNQWDMPLAETVINAL